MTPDELAEMNRHKLAAELGLCHADYNLAPTAVGDAAKFMIAGGLKPAASGRFLDQANREAFEEAIDRMKMAARHYFLGESAAKGTPKPTRKALKEMSAAQRLEHANNPEGAF